MRRTQAKRVILRGAVLGGCALLGLSALVGCDGQTPSVSNQEPNRWKQPDAQTVAAPQLSGEEEPGRLPPLDQEALDTLSAIRRQQGGIFAGSSFEGDVSPAAEQAEFQQALVQSQSPAPSQEQLDSTDPTTVLRAAAVALEHLAATAEAEEQPDAAERFRALAGELRSEVRRLTPAQQTEKTGNPAPNSATAN